MLSTPARPGVRTAANVVVSVALAAVGIRTAPELLVGLAVAAALGMSCEVLAPLHEGARSRRAYAVDLTHALADRSMIVPLVAVALGVVGPAVEAAVPGSARDALAALPWLALVGVTLVVTDFTNYLAHRALHRVQFLWAFHAVHHSSERLDWLATSRAHPIDLAVNIVAVTLPTYALGQVELAPWLVTFFFVHPFVMHANARLRMRSVGAVLVTPAFHHWHHAAAGEAHDRNFGTFLSLWDHLFGTALDHDEFPEEYGIGTRDLEATDYLGHLALPFRTARLG
ncbi:MAG TPA: sterol desaturase family protein [Acidimicrobiales bacterium]|nr:sterol desaturase family protein [Acidimicrobiales bacterium]